MQASGTVVFPVYKNAEIYIAKQLKKKSKSPSVSVKEKYARIFSVASGPLYHPVLPWKRFSLELIWTYIFFQDKNKIFHKTAQNPTKNTLCKGLTSKEAK